MFKLVRVWRRRKYEENKAHLASPISTRYSWFWSPSSATTVRKAWSQNTRKMTTKRRHITKDQARCLISGSIFWNFEIYETFVIKIFVITGLNLNFPSLQVVTRYSSNVSAIKIQWRHVYEKLKFPYLMRNTLLNVFITACVMFTTILGIPVTVWITRATKRTLPQAKRHKLSLLFTSLTISLL